MFEKKHALIATTLALVTLGPGCSPESESTSGGATATETETSAVELDRNPLEELPLGLDVYGLKVPEDNPPTVAKAELGRHLYFDKRLSKDRTVSCATCHDPEKGWTDQEAVSTGIGGQAGGRSAPTVINRAFGMDQFWDGRAASLEDQAKGPMTNPIEMGMSSHDLVVERVSAIEGYRPLFERAFGDDTVNIDRMAKAIATFERTIVSGNSPYDRHQNGEEGAMSESAVRGLALFNGKARCSVCHAGFNFTDEDYHNLGVGMDKPADEIDKGREEFTKDPQDRGKFKTPTLRNIKETFPYMHDGSEKTLMEVVELYDKGGVRNPNLDKEMRPLELTEQEKKDLVAFMEALSGEVTKVEIPEPVE